MYNVFFYVSSAASISFGSNDCLALLISSDMYNSSSTRANFFASFRNTNWKSSTRTLPRVSATPEAF